MPLAPYLLRARTLTGFSDLVKKLGGDPVAMLRSEGLSPEVIETPEASVPLHVLPNLLRLAAESLNVPDFGMRMAGYQDITILGAIALIALNSETVGEAVDGVMRGMPYHSPALRTQSWREGGRAYLRVTNDIDVDDVANRHLAEYTYLNAVTFIRAMAQVSGADWEVRFRHRPGVPPARYQEIFRCKVNFEQALDMLIIPAEVLDIRIRAANPELRAAAERYMRSMMRRHPLDIARQVEDLVMRQLSSGRCSLPVVAGQLAVSAKTLQRRLGEQGVRFEEIVDNVRRRRTEELLPIHTLPLQRIADTLGYTSQSSFTRSCRRWFGAPPAALRERRLAELGQERSAAGMATAREIRRLPA